MSPVSSHAARVNPPSSGAASSPKEAIRMLRVGLRTKARILAVGAERQSSVCLHSGNTAYLGPTLGDLTDPAVYRAFQAQIDLLKRRAGYPPNVVAHDLHPLYVTTMYARSLELPAAAVQHHHAHVAAVMAERRISGPVIGICCDGVGFGDDGAAWGCEVLVCRFADYQRAGHLAYFPLLGGDAAAVDTWRSAYALVCQAGVPEDEIPGLGAFAHVAGGQIAALRKLSHSRINAPPTSSLGRVFDGVSFLMGLCDRNDRPAQAAAALEKVALPGAAEPYPYETVNAPDGIRMSLAATIRGVLRDLNNGENRGRISARFHETAARMLSAAAQIAAEKHGIRRIVLAGGCFLNQRLLARLSCLLEKRRLEVYLPRVVSIGDAGIALGQAAIAAAMADEKE